MLPFKNLLRRKVRSLFAVLQIAVAIAAFVSIVGVTQGLRAQFYLLSHVFAFDVILQPKGLASPIFAQVTADEAAAVASVQGVGGASRLGFMATPQPGKAQPFTILALEPEGELISRYRVLQGRSFEASDGAAVMIGRLLAQERGLQVGSQVQLAGHPWEVVGIFEGLQEVPFLSGQAIVPMEQFRQRFGSRTRPLEPQILVAHTAPGRRATNDAEVAEGKRLAAEVVPRLEAALPRMKAATVADFLDSFKQVELIDSFALAISLLSALVSGIGVANTMLMSVFDRTREIGLLRAIGWSRVRIVSMIEAEGLILAVAGGLLGIPFGYLLILGAQLLVSLGWLQVTLDVGLYGRALVVAALIGVLASLYPAVRAARLEPTEALRHE